MSRSLRTSSALALAFAVLGACQGTATDQPAADMAIELTLDKTP